MQTLAIFDFPKQYYFMAHKNNTFFRIWYWLIYVRRTAYSPFLFRLCIILSFLWTDRDKSSMRYLCTEFGVPYVTIHHTEVRWHQHHCLLGVGRNCKNIFLKSSRLIFFTYGLNFFYFYCRRHPLLFHGRFGAKTIAIFLEIVNILFNTWSSFYPYVWKKLIINTTMA